jgi:hypothetical protein
VKNDQPEGYLLSQQDHFGKEECNLHKKKWLAILTILILGMGLLTGCSPAEKNYYSLMMEINSQKVYTDSGSFQINLAQLPTSNVAAGGGAFDQTVLMKALNQHSIDYIGKVDANQKVMQYDLTIVDTSNGARSAFLSLLLKNDVFYLKIDDMIKYLGQYSSPNEKQQLDKALGDVVWVSLSAQELKAMMPEGSQNIFGGDLFQMSSTQQKVWQRLLDGLVNDAYKGYQSGLIIQNNNQYTFTLKGADLFNVMKPAAVYTINNIDAVGTVLKTFLNSLNNEEAGVLGLTAQMKTEMMQGIDAMVLEVNQNRVSYLYQLENLSPMASQQTMQTFNDSELVISLEKSGANTYKQSNRLHVHITSGPPSESMEFTITQQHTMNTGGAVQVAVPSGPVITYTGLQQRMPVEMNVNVASGAYVSEHGFMSSSGTMEVQLVGGRTYLPLRRVGESLGEKVGWDQAAYQAYVLQNGGRIYMTGLLINDRAYVKLRDFERLGYIVSWDEMTSTATISR